MPVDSNSSLWDGLVWVWFPGLDTILTKDELLDHLEKGS